MQINDDETAQAALKIATFYQAVLLRWSMIQLSILPLRPVISTSMLSEIRVLHQAYHDP